MKKLFAVLLLLAATPAFAFTPSQIRQQFANCAWFLHLSPAAKAKAARKAGHPVQVLVNSCRYQQKVGLKRTIELENEYQSYLHPRRGRSSGGDSGGCSHSSDCYANQHCVAGSCESQSYSCAGLAGSCGFGEKCDNGVCK